MKLDWEINEFRVLGAKVGEVTYYVAPGVANLWTPSKRYAAFDGKAATVWPVEGGMSLTNAIAWCERDVERPEGCPAQPPAADPAAPKTSGEMSGKTSSPLGSFDARVWAKKFMRCNNGLSGPFVSSHVWVDEETMVGWFANALMRGYDERRSRENGWQKFTRDTYAEFLAKNPYPPPPSAQAPEPPSVEEAARLSRPVTQVDVEQYVGKVVKSHFDLLWKHVETMPVRMEGLSGPETRRNVEALSRRLIDLEVRLEAQTRAHANTRQELDEFVKALDDRLAKEDILGVHPMTAVGKEAQEIKKRLIDLEARVMGNSAELPM